MALSWTDISSNTKIKKQIIDEIFNNLKKVELSVGIKDYQAVGSITNSTGSLAISKDLIDIYRRLNEAYWMKFSKFPTFTHIPINQGQFSAETIIEIQNILNSFGV